LNKTRAHAAPNYVYINDMETEKNEKNKKKHSLSYILGGKILIEDFVIKQAKLLILIVILLLVFISNKYHCAKKVTEFNKLKNELMELQNEQVILISRLTTISTQSNVEQLLREKESTLSRNGDKVYQIQK